MRWQKPSSAISRRDDGSRTGTSRPDRVSLTEIASIAASVNQLRNACGIDPHPADGCSSRQPAEGPSS